MSALGNVSDHVYIILLNIVFVYEADDFEMVYLHPALLDWLSHYRSPMSI